MEPIRYLGDVPRLVLNPGDALVITVDRTITDSEREHIQRTLVNMFETNKVLVLEKGMKIGVMGNGEASTAED